MFKKVFFLTLVFVFSGLVFAGELVLKFQLPDFVLNNPYFSSSPIDKYIQVGIFSDNRKVLSFSGYNKSGNSSLKTFSKVIFLNSQNEVEKELNFNFHIKTKAIDNISNPIVAVTILKIEGNDYYADKINIYSSKGELICTIPNKEHNYVYSSIDNKFLCLVGVMEIDAGNFTFIPIKAFKENNKDNLPQYSLSLSGNPAEHWILLGGKNASLIYSTQTAIKKVSLKNKVKIEWKIFFTEDYVNFIKLINNFVVAEAFPNFYIIDEKTGKILKKVNLKNNPRVKSLIDDYNFTITKNLEIVEDENSPCINQPHSPLIKTKEKTYYFTVKNKNVLIFAN